MKKNLLIFVTLIIMTACAVECFGELYSLSSLTPEQQEFLKSETMCLQTSMGLSMIGLGLLYYPMDTELIGFPVFSVLFGLYGVRGIMDALLSRKKTMGRLIYNREKGLYLKRMITDDEKMSIGISFTGLGVLMTGMGIMMEELSEVIGAEETNTQLCWIAGGVLTCISGVIMFIDSFREFPAKEEEGYKISMGKKRDRVVNLGMDIRVNFLGIKAYKTF